MDYYTWEDVPEEVREGIEDIAQFAMDQCDKFVVHINRLDVNKIKSLESCKDYFATLNGYRACGQYWQGFWHGVKQSRVEIKKGMITKN